jgi:hypothetical protein
MIWNDVLKDGEQILWEARPAPRCFVFRQWRQALFGAVFLLLCLVWQSWGVAVARAHDAVWAAWLPLPFVLIGLQLSAGRLIAARLEWPHVVYAITDFRLLVRCGLLRRRLLSLELTEITGFRLIFLSENLGTLHIYREKERLQTLYCLEYPRRATDLLEEALGKRNEALSAE